MEDVVPITPHIRCSNANETIELGRGPVNISQGKFKVDAKGVARLLLAPKCRVVVSVNLPAIKENRRDWLQDEFTYLRFGKFGRPTKTICIRNSFSSAGKNELDFLPTGGPFSIFRDQRIRLKNTIFHLINFQNFLCATKHSSDFSFAVGTGQRRLGRVILKDSNWAIEIQALPQTNEIVDQLTLHGGHAITHVGRLERVDGGSFSINAANNALTHLQHFLSFARGQWCAPFGIVGTSTRGEILYEDWSQRLVSPWATPPSWFDDLNGQWLADCYPGFIRLLKDPSLGKSVADALYWYLRSNRGGEGAGVDGGLLLAQAALERLANAYLQKTSLSASGYAAQRIRQMCEKLAIPIQLSKSTKNLRRARGQKTWIDGPGAISKIRNELIHAKSQLQVPLHSVIWEASQLAHWYIELIILRLSGYNGHYSNRIVARHIGDKETVPWKKNTRRKA